MNRRVFLRVSGQGLGLLCLTSLGAGCASSKRGAAGFDPGPYSVGDQQLVFDADSSAFVLDGPGHVIHDLDDAAQVEGVFGSLGDDPGELNHPVAATVHRDELLVLDRGNGRVQVFDQSGRLQRVIGRDLKLPRGLAAVDDRVYVCDTMGHRVRVYSTDGAELPALGGDGSGQGTGPLNAPVGVVVDSGGDVHVLDKGNARVKVFSPDGDSLRTYGSYGAGKGQMLSPGSLVLTPDGRVYISDEPAGCVHVFRQEGEFLGRFRPVDERGERVAPRQVQLRHDGGVYIWSGGQGVG